MNDKNDVDESLDDDFYDDALDENFDFDEEDYDIDLDSDLDDGTTSEFDEEEGDWGDGNVESALDSNEKPKFALNFNTMVIIGAVVVGGFIVMSQVSKEQASVKEKQGKVTEIIPTALKMGGAFNGPGAIQEEKKIAAPVFNSQTEVIDEGFLFDADILDRSEEIIEEAPPMPSPIVSDAPEKAGDGLALEEAHTDSTGLLLDNELDVADIVFDKGAEDAVLVESKPVIEEEIKEVEVENSTPPVLEQPSVVLETVEIDLQSATSSLASQENTLEEEKEESSLGRKLDSIIDRLGAMESKIEAIEKVGHDQMGAIAADVDALKGKFISPEVAVQKTVDLKKEVKKKEVTPKVVKKASPKKAVKKVQWELRAAQPGKAWVSQKGQKNMKPVVVGDQLTGIGRITNISYISNQWIVQGSAGKITQ